MRLRTEKNLMRLHLFISVFFAHAYYSYAEKSKDTRPLKTMIVRDIMKKVSNITLNALANVPDDKKTIVLKKIEQKLLRTARGLTNGDKYVQFIMQEFKKQAFSNKETNNDFRHLRNKPEDTLPYHTTITTKTTTTTTTSTTTERPEIDTTPDASSKIYDIETKKRLINDIARKIENTAKNYLKASQTLTEKENILAKIREKIEEKAKQRHAEIHDQHNELKMYSNLISQGFELSMTRLLHKYPRRSNLDNHGDSFLDMPVKENETFPNTTYDIVSYIGHYNITESIKQYQMDFTGIWQISHVLPRCANLTRGICRRLEELDKLSCGGTYTISVNQLCDGMPDCTNGLDETSCTDQAAAKLRKSLSIMYDLDEIAIANCFPPVPSHDTLLDQHRTLENMLVKVKHVLEKYKPVDMDIHAEQNNAEDTLIKNTVLDLRNALNTMSHAFDDTLCRVHRHVKQAYEYARRSNTNASSEKELEWTPKSCTCKRQHCKDENCDNRCRGICYQKYSLNHWECQSITGETMISLNLICDGKLDCYDESDEMSCSTVSSYAKYQANELYKQVLDILSLKILSMEYKNSRLKLAEQINIVHELQKRTTSTSIDRKTIKLYRGKFFKILVQVYTDLMKTFSQHKLELAYDFLLMLSQKMITALKLSHTGNKSHFSPIECLCRNGTCAVVRCSKKCNLTCQLELTLTRYACNASNTSINTRGICDGKNDCPNEDDEKDCSKEVCRTHHLILLRHKLERVGLSQRGTMVGEEISKWKSRVISTMALSPGKQRPTRKNIQNFVMEVLHDLVTVSATIEETRRRHSKVLAAEFRNIADIVKQTLKTCGQ